MSEIVYWKIVSTLFFVGISTLFYGHGEKENNPRLYALCNRILNVIFFTGLASTIIAIWS